MLEQIFTVFLRSLPAIFSAYRKLGLSTWAVSAAITGFLVWANTIEETPNQLSPEQRAEVEASINQDYNEMSEERARDVCLSLLRASDYDANDFLPNRCFQWKE